eukprot:612629-Rhodomonas_salina.1
MRTRLGRNTSRNCRLHARRAQSQQSKKDTQTVAGGMKEDSVRRMENCLGPKTETAVSSNNSYKCPQRQTSTVGHPVCAPGSRVAREEA